MKYVFVILAALLAFKAATAQSLDSYRVSRSNETTVDNAMHDFVTKNDVKGLRGYLGGSAAKANAASRVQTTQGKVSTIDTPMPLIFDVVYNCLDGNCSTEMFEAVLETGADMYVPYDGKTVIYVVLDRIATMPVEFCATEEELLRLMTKYKIKINNRYAQLPPPLTYLMRRTKEYNGVYSTDYVSDNAIKLLLQAGANINAYDKDGNNLLDFAILTGNDRLCTYFIRKGVDVLHNTKSGTNTLREAIAVGNLQIVKEMEEYGNANIDINSLENNTRDISRYPELYQYLAHLCSFKAEIYEDVVLFRSRFPDKRDMVKDKYENLCRKEVAAAKIFADILRVEYRYPDLPSITTPKKESIYRSDCQKLQNYLNKTLTSLNGRTSFEDGDKILEDDDIVQYFSANYRTNNYDPDGKIYIVEELNYIKQVHEAVKMQIGWYFSEHKYPVLYFLGLAPSPTKPVFDQAGSQHDYNTINAALSVVSNLNSKCGFNNFCVKVKPYLDDKLIRLVNRVNSNIATYNAEVEKYNKKVEEHRRLMDKVNREAKEREQERERERENERIAEENRKQEEQAQREAESKKIKELVNGDEFPAYKMEGNWSYYNMMDAMVAFAFGNKIPGTYSCVIKYNDGVRGSIARTEDNKIFYSEAANKGYETIKDALAAEYFYQKYSIVREKGRI